MNVGRDCRAALAGLFVCLAAPAQAFQVDIGQETITMESKYNKPALFPHRRHQGWYGCTACHHAKGQVMTIDKCGACHNDGVKSSPLDSVRKAAHALCKDCHSKERANGRTAAPSGCISCHPPMTGAE
jgi:hypothetical protein